MLPKHHRDSSDLNHMYMLPNGESTCKADIAASEWASAFYHAKTALMRLNSVLNGKGYTASELEIIRNECEEVLKMG